MGYTHYWRNNASTARDRYLSAINDIKKIVEHEKHRLANWEGEAGTEPEFKTIVSFNGVGKECCETFLLPEELDEVKPFNCCKTNRRGYDDVVCACLCVLSEVPGIAVRSDGDDSEWEDGVELAKKILCRNVSIPESV